MRNRPRNIKCAICGEHFIGFGNNAEPYARGRCCNDCNTMCVIPARLDNLRKGLPRDAPYTTHN